MHALALDQFSGPKATLSKPVEVDVRNVTN